MQTTFPNKSTKPDSTVDGKRIVWIDNARGFVMTGTVLGWLTPQIYRDRASLLLTHPIDPKTIDGMTIPDIGILAYLMIMGMMTRVSYERRHHEQSYFEILVHVLRRSLFLLIAALVFHGWGIASEQNVPLERAGLPVFLWGALYTLSICSFLSGLCTPIGTDCALIISVTLITFYQFLLHFPEIPEYVSGSFFGGPLGAVMGFFPAMLFSFALADWTILHAETSRKTVLTRLLGLGLGMLLIAFILHEPYTEIWIFNMRRITLPYLLAASGTVTIGIAAFSSLPVLRQIPIPIVASLGKNSLAVFLGLLCEHESRRYFGTHNSVLWAATTFTVIVLLAIWLDRKKIQLKV